LAEMARVTRPAGLVVIFEHNPWNPLTRKAVAGCEFDRDAELLSRRESEALLRGAGLTELEASYIVFFTRESPRLQWIERRLARLPLGAQHVVSGRRP
jgi:SAM-dependent methyltransferase